MEIVKSYYDEVCDDVSETPLDVHFVSPAPVQSPLGVGAQHAAPLPLLAGY
jgi:hypothetical protein